MKREIILALAGLSILMADDAAAQRNRGGDRGGDRARERGSRVEQPAPIRAPGRVYRVGPTRHPGAVRSRVVYTSRSRHPRYASGWVRADFGVVRFELGRFGRHAFLNAGELRHVIGRDAMRMVRDAGRHAGLRGPMRGRWIPTRGPGHVLLVTVGGVEVAEFEDWDRDGFVDDVYLIPQGRYRRVW